MLRGWVGARFGPFPLAAEGLRRTPSTAQPARLRCLGSHSADVGENLGSTLAPKVKPGLLKWAAGGPGVCGETTSG